MADWINVARVDELPPGSRQVIEIDGARIIILNVDEQYFAIEDVCSHDGGELCAGLLEGDEIVCPRHGARFSIRTGAALTPPAYQPIATFPVRVLNGLIQVQDNRWD